MNKPTSRREQEREHRRRLMLQAARSVFAERGFKQASIDEIAQRAEFAKGTIYNYFPEGKDQILFAILDDVYDELHEISVNAFKADQNGSFAHSLDRFITAFLNYFVKEEDLFVILLKEANRLAFSDDPSKANYLKNQFHRIAEVVEPKIDVAIQNGELKPFPAHAVAHMILGNVHGYLRFHCLERIDAERGEPCEPQSIPEAARFISEILLNGLSAAPDRLATEKRAESKEAATTEEPAGVTGNLE